MFGAANIMRIGSNQKIHILVILFIWCIYQWSIFYAKDSVKSYHSF